MLKVRCNYKHKYLIISSSDYKGSTVNNKDAMVTMGDRESGGRKQSLEDTWVIAVIHSHSQFYTYTYKRIHTTPFKMTHTLRYSHSLVLQTPPSLPFRQSHRTLFSFHLLAYSQIMYNLEVGMASVFRRFIAQGCSLCPVWLSGYLLEGEPSVLQSLPL